ncbi:CHAT domain-containing protein [Actinoplanes sp. NPDC049668]|uniref:CHAT domain-containing protein n=1 Tax=unclassified Actinoplanes TaxID=2626549 RepID=UPI0033A0E22B
MLRQIGQTVTVVRDAPGGQTRMDVRASIQGRKGFFEVDTDLEEGDLIEQAIPGGKVVVHRVTDVAHHIGPARFQGNHIEAQLSKAPQTPQPRTVGGPEALRILYLTAAPKSDLRMDVEVREVGTAIRAATHRDMVAFEMMPAATGTDLLDGLTRFRPHVVHFSGHANETALSFDSGDTGAGFGTPMKAATFVRAIEAVDQRPRLVLLNACKSAAQLTALTSAVSAAIGMNDSIRDDAAIRFAARFYAAIAEGQSLLSALKLGQVELDVRGIAGADLPTLETAQGIDPASLFLLQ